MIVLYIFAISIALLAGAIAGLLKRSRRSHFQE